jgi:hypothetical protein
MIVGKKLLMSRFLVEIMIIGKENLKIVKG